MFAIKSHNKTFLRIAAAFLCAAIAFISTGVALPAVYAETPSQKLERLEKEKASIEKALAENKNDINKQTQNKKLYAEKAELERQKLESLSETIRQQEENLVQKQNEIADKIRQIEETRTLYEKRLVAIYKKKDRATISALLSVNSFGSLMRSAKNLQRIAKADNELMALLAAQQQELETMRAGIEADITKLNETKAQSEEAKKEYENSLLRAEIALDEAAAEKEANEALYSDLLPKIEQAEREHQAWVSQDTQGGEFTGGVFSWPLPGYTVITSGFNDSRNLSGSPDVHRGLDVRAPAGTPIYAAADGTASTSGHHYTYGNCVKISHGGGVVSVYAHMLGFADGISDGVKVTKGQLIGYVGASGRAYGVHLHFEVDVNGVPTNPFTYVKG